MIKVDPHHHVIIPVVRRADYECAVEQLGDITFAHCHVRRWNHLVRDELRRDIQRFFELHGGPLYALLTGGPKQHKFFSLFGFVPFGVGYDAEGAECPLYKKVS